MNVINLKRILADNDGCATLDVRGSRIPVAIHTIRADYTHPDKVMELFCTVDPRAMCTYGGRLLPEIKKVIFNDPITVVIWTDGSKTVVRTQNGEEYDPEKGLAMAISKKAFGNTGSYFEQFKKWVPKEDTVDLSCEELARCTSMSEFAETLETLEETLEEQHAEGVT